MTKAQLKEKLTMYVKCLGDRVDARDIHIDIKEGWSEKFFIGLFDYKEDMVAIDKKMALKGLRGVLKNVKDDAEIERVGLSIYSDQMHLYCEYYSGETKTGEYRYE